MPVEPMTMPWPVGGFAGIGDEAAPDLAGQVAAIERLGWHAIELRTVDGVPLADLDRAGRARLARLVRRAGISVVCLDSRIGGWAGSIGDPFDRDLAELRALAGLCAELGTGYVRIMSYPNAGLSPSRWRRAVLDRMRALAEVAQAAGITLLHENCAGWAADSAERMLDLLAQNENLRLLFDVGNGVAHGYHAPDLLAELVPWVAHVHVKDATGGGADTSWTLPGDGRAGVLACLCLLREGGYRGALSIEPHLATVPHEGRWACTGASAAFVAAGERLAELVREQVHTA